MRTGIHSCLEAIRHGKETWTCQLKWFHMKNRVPKRFSCLTGAAPPHTGTIAGTLMWRHTFTRGWCIGSQSTMQTHKHNYLLDYRNWNDRWLRSCYIKRHTYHFEEESLELSLSAITQFFGTSTLWIDRSKVINENHKIKWLRKVDKLSTPLSNSRFSN